MTMKESERGTEHLSERSAGWVASSRVVVSVALTVSLAGLAIPYGASSPGVPGDLSVVEWVLSGAALLAAVGLVLDLTRPLRPRVLSQGSFALAAGVWFTVAAYFLFLNDAMGWAESVSEALRSLAWAGLALYEWRRTSIAPRVVVTDG